MTALTVAISPLISLAVTHGHAMEEMPPLNDLQLVWSCSCGAIVYAMYCELPGGPFLGASHEIHQSCRRDLLPASVARSLG